MEKPSLQATEIDSVTLRDIVR